MDYEVGMQVRVVAIPHGYCSTRIGDILTVTEVTDHGIMATTHAGLQKHYSFRAQGKYHLHFPLNAIEPVVEDEGKTLKELGVKPGDVVEFVSCEYNPSQYFYPEEPKTVISNNFSSVGVSVYGIFPEFDHAIWKVVSRAGETKAQKEEDNIEVFYGFDGIGFFDVEHPYYDERLVLNHTTGTFTLERI